MRPNLAVLRSYLDDVDADGYLVDEDAGDPDQRYLSGYDAGDPFVTLVVDDEIHLLFWGMDYFRSQGDTNATAVHRPLEYGYDGYGSLEEQHRVVADLLDDHGVETVAVPERFPLGTAADLRTHGIEVVRADRPIVSEMRGVKTPAEIEQITRTARIAEKGMRAAERLVEEAAVVDGALFVDGEPLTGARVKHEIRTTLFEHGCLLEDPVVSNGRRPLEDFPGAIPAGQTIQIDVAPTHLETGYCSDMNRTFVKGDPHEEFRDRYELVKQALDLAVAEIEPGTTGADVNDLLCGFFEDRGYATPRTEDGVDDRVGVPHFMGHGVGLEVHEDPVFSPEGGRIDAGYVLAIEPGLYEPERRGGVIVEDLVHVTESGCERITDYHGRLVID
jgi:Xaa-Pro aminopeptidase